MLENNLEKTERKLKQRTAEIKRKKKYNLYVKKESLARKRRA